MTAITQEALRRQLVADNDEVSRSVVALAGDLDAQEVLRPPADGGWSVGRLLEHLCVAHDSYLVPMRRLVDDPRAPRRPGTDTAWSPRFGGWMLVHSFRNARWIPTPRQYVVGPAPRAGVLVAFLDRQRELGALLERSAALDWRAIRTVSPITSLIRLNLGDGFLIVIEHAKRDLRHLVRLRGEILADRRRSSPA